MSTEEFSSEEGQAENTAAQFAAAYPELEKLKAANELLREQGKEWLLTTLETIVDDLNHHPSPQSPSPETPASPTLQVGSQEWQFEIEKNVMVGERLGIRHRGQTLLVEVGWPRLPEHGIVPDLGLARARVSMSPNVMIDAILLDDLTLRREKDGVGVLWHVLAGHTLREPVTEETLRGYVQRAMTS